MVKCTPTQWTDWTEAISFVSATLGCIFTTAQGSALYWTEPSNSACEYPVGLELVDHPVERVRVMVNIEHVIVHADLMKLYAILGWAHSKHHLIDLRD